MLDALYLETLQALVSGDFNMLGSLCMGGIWWRALGVVMGTQTFPISEMGAPGGSAKEWPELTCVLMDLLYDNRQKWGEGKEASRKFAIVHLPPVKAWTRGGTVEWWRSEGVMSWVAFEGRPRFAGGRLWSQRAGSRACLGLGVWTAESWSCPWLRHVELWASGEQVWVGVPGGLLRPGIICIGVCPSQSLRITVVPVS